MTKANSAAVTSQEFYWCADDEEVLHCVCGNPSDLVWANYHLGKSERRCNKCGTVAQFIDNDEGGSWIVQAGR